MSAASGPAGPGGATPAGPGAPAERSRPRVVALGARVLLVQAATLLALWLLQATFGG